MIKIWKKTTAHPEGEWLTVSASSSEVTKEYVDTQDESTLNSSKAYTDSKIGEAGKVQDVKLNGTSVVADKVANINLATVATSGKYSDLTEKPDLTIYAKKDDLATVATSGDYDDLGDKPQIDGFTLSGNKTLDQLGIQAKGDYATTTALTAETNARTTADTTLQSNITSEETRAKAAEQANATAISNEESRAKGVEDTKLNLPGKETVSQLPYNLPYYFYVVKNGNKLVAHAKTIALDNVFTQGDYSLDALEVDGTTIAFVDGKLSAQLPDIMRLKGQKASIADLPDPADVGDIYFVRPAGATSSTMHCWIDSTTKYLEIGSTTIDLSEYQKTADADAKYATITSVNTVSTNLATEVTNRTAADTTLQSNIDAKQDALNDKNKLNPEYVNFTTAQSDALSSGITATKVSAYDGYATSKQDTIDSTHKLSVTLVDGLAAVATSGSYDDLTNKPTIPAAQVQSDWNETDTTKKSYIVNKPTIPTLPEIETAIGSTSTNAKVAGAKAVYDYHDSSKLDATKCTYKTSAPTAAATDNGVHIVYLTTEPTTKYEGYIYFIK